MAAPANVQWTITLSWKGCWQVLGGSFYSLLLHRDVDILCLELYAGKVHNCCCQNIKLQGVECIQVLSVWLDSIHAIYPKMRALFALLIQTGQYVCTKIGRLFDLLAKLDGSSPVSLWDVDGGDSSSKCWVWEGTSLTGKLFFWHSKECPIFLGSQEFWKAGILVSISAVLQGIRKAWRRKGFAVPKWARTSHCADSLYALAIGVCVLC